MQLSLAERAAKFTGSFPRSTSDVQAWHGRAEPEPILDPAQPIFDPHHHLYGVAGDRNFYTIEDMAVDLGSGHRVIGTAYIEAYGAGWRTDGPPEMRTVGEVDRIISLTSQPLSLPSGPCQIAAGIVAFADLMAGHAVVPVLDALAEAAQGRLCGIRYRTAVTGGTVGRTIVNAPPEKLMVDPVFQQGVKLLGNRGLAFDVWAYDEQLPEVMALADACPDVTFVLDHVGGVVGVGDSQADVNDRRQRWRADMKRLGERPNVFVKLGGMGMTMFGFGFEFLDVPADSIMLANAWRDNFDICVDAFGHERCMFESNFPVDAQCASYAVIWNAFKRLSIGCSAAERSALFFGAATQAYGLKAMAQECERLAAMPYSVNNAPEQ